MIEPNEDTRKNTYKELLAYIHEQGVYVPLSYSRTKAVHVPALPGGYVLYLPVRNPL